ncbi:Hypothetical_protein [Hexamita inflata]|uniref:Hypothetical_protein n=1 Tax=Hexamita inflata TaxID=28002 RepID=A0AA86QJU7_9EUKA|nr:Hypothetical protein HINF_LOCUS48484 [Hexamita inflata]
MVSGAFQMFILRPSKTCLVYECFFLYTTYPTTTTAAIITAPVDPIISPKFKSDFVSTSTMISQQLSTQFAPLKLISLQSSILVREWSLRSSFPTVNVEMGNPTSHVTPRRWIQTRDFKIFDHESCEQTFFAFLAHSK